MEKAKRYERKAEIALDLCVKLARASSTFAQLSSRDIRSYGLTEPQFSVVECLGHLGPLTLGDLSRKMLVSGGNITCVVDNLERVGIVERVHSTYDRRAVVARLTARGRKMFDEIFIRHARFITATASVLTEQEQKTLARLLRKLGLALVEKRVETRIRKEHHS